MFKNNLEIKLTQLKELHLTIDRIMRLILFRDNSITKRIFIYVSELNLVSILNLFLFEKSPDSQTYELDNNLFLKNLTSLSLSEDEMKYFSTFLDSLKNVKTGNVTPDNELYSELKFKLILLTLIISYYKNFLDQDLIFKLFEYVDEHKTLLDGCFEKTFDLIKQIDFINAKRQVKYPLKLYLDQKDWIQLARVWKKKEDDIEISNLLNKLMFLIDNKKIMMPISLNHVFETHNRENKTSRNDLADLMLLLSEGWTIIPYVTVIPFEIKNAVYKKLNMIEKIFPVEKMIFSRGIGNILGASPKLTQKEDSTQEDIEFEKDTIEAMMYTPQALKLMFGVRHKKTINERIKADEALILDLEKNRERFETQYSDKDLRRRARFAEHFISQINPILGKILIDENIPKEKYLDIVGSNPDECSSFIEEMPASFCSFALTRKRDEQTSSSVHQHDLYDIASLSIAIPYCNLVVCEKKFGNFAKQEKLDDKYNTLILKNLKELNKYLHY